MDEAHTNTCSILSLPRNILSTTFSIINVKKEKKILKTLSKRIRKLSGKELII